MDCKCPPSFYCLALFICSCFQAHCILQRRWQMRRQRIYSSPLGKFISDRISSRKERAKVEEGKWGHEGDEISSDYREWSDEYGRI